MRGARAKGGQIAARSLSSPAAAAKRRAPAVWLSSSQEGVLGALPTLLLTFRAHLAAPTVTGASRSPPAPQTRPCERQLLLQLGSIP